MIIRKSSWGIKPPNSAPLAAGDPINADLYDIYFSAGSLINDFSITNPVTFNQGTIVAGKFGPAINFNGSQYARQNIAPKSPPKWGNSWSISFWINPSNTVNDQYVFDHTNIRTILCGYQDNNINIFNGGYPTGTASDTQMPVSANVWTHFIYTTDGSTLRGYKNGAQVFNVNANLNPGAYSTLYFASAAGAAAFFTGGIDNVRLWNRALTKEDVFRLYFDPFAGYFSQFELFLNASAGSGVALTGQAISDVSGIPIASASKQLASSLEAENAGVLSAQLAAQLSGSSVALAQGSVTAVADGSVQLAGSTLTLPSNAQFISGIVVNL